MHYAYAQKPLGLPMDASNLHAFKDAARTTMLPAAALIFRQHHVRGAVAAYTWSPNALQQFDASPTPAWQGRLRLAAERGRLTPTPQRVEAIAWLRATDALVGSINVADAGDNDTARRGSEVCRTSLNSAGNGPRRCSVSTLRALPEPTNDGEIEIHAMTGFRSTEQLGVQVRREAGRYIVHFDGEAPVHWVSLRGSSKGAQ